MTPGNPFRKSLRLALIFVLAACSLAGQPVRITTSSSSAPVPPPSTSTLRAVVVGISEYRDPGIRKLQFAHKDAQAFADYLRSDAAGTMPKDIRLLTNREATLAAVDDALNWLKNSSKKGDIAVLYMACHGDLEQEALWQFGYLLTYDSPPNNFRNNAVRVEDLDVLAIDLSSVRNVRTMFFLDACHSGTLASGRNIPTENLAKQQANEVRVLSCKPDQLSMEGPEWGGGRGVFSYYLIRGLQGLANEEDNTEDANLVTIEELSDFLKKTVVKDTKAIGSDKRQDPVVVAGEESFPLSNVVPTILAAVEAESSHEATMDGDLTGRGSRGGDGEENFLVEESPVDLWQEISKLLTRDEVGEVFPAETLAGLPASDLGPALLDELNRLPEKLPLSSSDEEALKTFLDEGQRILGTADGARAFNLKLGLAMHDRCQEVLNSYLSANPEDLEQRSYFTWSNSKYRWYPAIFTLALHLLPEDHPLYALMAVKEAYYRGVSLRLSALVSPDAPNLLQQALDTELEALRLDDKAPYIHNELGILYDKLGQPEMAEQHYSEATRLAPGWALPWNNLGGHYLDKGRVNEARIPISRALELFPDYPAAHLNKGRIDQADGALLDAEADYYRGIQLDPKHFAGYELLGRLYLITAEYEDAEQNLETADSLRRNLVLPPGPLEISQNFVLDLNQWGPPPDIDSTWFERIRKDPDNPDLRFGFGVHLSETGHHDLAIVQLETAIRLKPDYPMVYDHLGWAHWKLGHQEEALHAIQEAAEREPLLAGRQFLLANIHEAMGRYLEAETLYQGLADSAEYTLAIARAIGGIRERTGRFAEAESTWQSLPEDQNPTAELYRFYERMMARFPDKPHWMLRMATLRLPHCLAQNEKQDLQAFTYPHEETDWKQVMNVVTGYYQSGFNRKAMPMPGELRTWPLCCQEPLDILGRAYPFLATPEERASVQMDRGRILAWMEKPEEAATAFESGLAQDPTREDIRDQAVNAYLVRHRLPEARWQRMVQDTARHLSFPEHLTLARWHVLAGDYTHADSLLARAEHFFPDIDEEEQIVLWTARRKLLSGDKGTSAYYQEQAGEWITSEVRYGTAASAAVSGKPDVAFQALKAAFKDDQILPFVLAKDPRLGRLKSDAQWSRLMKKYDIHLPEG